MVQNGIRLLSSDPPSIKSNNDTNNFIFFYSFNYLYSEIILCQALKRDIVETN